MIDHDEAVRIARQAVDGVLDVPDDSPAEVACELTVTFPTDLEPGVRGPDHHARVTIDGVSGEVIEILGG